MFHYFQQLEDQKSTLEAEIQAQKDLEVKKERDAERKVLAAQKEMETTKKVHYIIFFK